MLLLAGCGKNVIASYKYITPETVHDLTIRKVEYTEDSLYIYVSGSDAKRITPHAITLSLKFFFIGKRYFTFFYKHVIGIGRNILYLVFPANCSYRL